MHMLKSSVFGCVIVSSRAFRKTLDDLCVWREIDCTGSRDAPTRDKNRSALKIAPNRCMGCQSNLWSNFCFDSGKNN